MYPKLECGNGMYPGDFEISLTLTVPVQSLTWVRSRLDDTITSGTFSTVLDGVTVTLGGCRLAIDQSPMTATAGYDETLTISAASITYTIS